MTDRIPAHLRTKRNDGASTAKIFAAGMSVSAGVAMIGAMAATSASSDQPAAGPAPITERIIVIQQPVPAGQSTPALLPQAPTRSAPEVVGIEPVSESPSEQAQASPQKPVTVTEGS